MLILLHFLLFYLSPDSLVSFERFSMCSILRLARGESELLGGFRIFAEMKVRAPIWEVERGEPEGIV